MARRRMTLRRIDPWSVLKFGFVLNVCLFAVVVLGFAILWYVVGQLGLIDQACQLAEDVGFEDCGVDTGALFRVVGILAGLGAVIFTGLAVFGAFLHNLLADLVGGIEVSLTDDRPRAQAVRSATTERTPPPSEEPVGSPDGRAPRGEGSEQAADEPRWTLGSPPPRPDTAGTPTERVGGPAQPPDAGEEDAEEDLFGGRDEQERT